MTSRERNLAVVAGAVAVFVAYYLFLLGPVLSSARETEIKIDRAETRLSELTAYGSLGLDPARELERLRSQVDYDPARTSAAHQNRMIRAVSAACNESGAALVNAVPMDASAVDGRLVRHPIQVQVKGDLPAVVVMLDVLSGVHPIMAVERMTMDYDEKTDIFSVQMLLVSLTPAGDAESA